MKLVAIIPAYNEATTIAAVVTVATRHPRVESVIVIDDGSSDETALRALRASAQLITNRKNLGKAEAMERGVAAASEATHFLFLDADLVGFRKEHIDALLAPIDTGAAMSIGMRDRGRVATALNVSLLPWISGERIVSRALWDAVPREWKHGFMIELALNATARKKRHSVVPVILSGLSIVRKEQKFGLMRGLRMRARMIAQMIAVGVRIMLR